MVVWRDGGAEAATQVVVVVLWCGRSEGRGEREEGQWWPGWCGGGHDGGRDVGGGHGGGGGAAAATQVVVLVVMVWWSGRSEGRGESEKKISIQIQYKNAVFRALVGNYRAVNSKSLFYFKLLIWIQKASHHLYFFYFDFSVLYVVVFCACLI